VSVFTFCTPFRACDAYPVSYNKEHQINKF